MTMPDLTSAKGASKRRPEGGAFNRFRAYLRPRAALSSAERLTVSTCGIIVFFGAWFLVTATGVVEPFFLPSPVAVAKRLGEMLLFEGYSVDILASASRVFGGFLIASVVAVPVGILIGNFPFFRAALEPILSTARYLPATAFVPLMIIWLGINEAQKMAVIVIGTFFPLVLFIASISEGVSSDLLLHSRNVRGQ